MTEQWLGVLAIAAMSLTGWSQSQPQDRFAITADQVARAVSAGGIEVAGGQVSLLANVVATEPKPLLDVLSVETLGDKWSGGHSGTNFWIKLACHTPGECLPFYAIVSLPRESDGRAPDKSDAPLTALKSNVAITMRAGAHATLVMDDDLAHIQIAVISLENGITGHRIRVASPDHKQVYVAEVINASLLRKSF